MSCPGLRNTVALGVTSFRWSSLPVLVKILTSARGVLCRGKRRPLAPGTCCSPTTRALGATSKVDRKRAAPPAGCPWIDAIARPSPQRQSTLRWRAIAASLVARTLNELIVRPVERVARLLDFAANLCRRRARCLIVGQYHSIGLTCDSMKAISSASSLYFSYSCWSISGIDFPQSMSEALLKS